MFAALPFAVAAALLLARTRFPGKIVVDGIIHLPLVLPPVAIGFLLLIVLRHAGGARRVRCCSIFGIRFVFSWTGAALASALITFPFQVRAIRLALESADPGLDAGGRDAWARAGSTGWSISRCRSRCPASSRV